MFPRTGLFLAIAVSALAQSTPDGKALFEKNCAVCHRAGAADNRAPLPEELAKRPNQEIVTALEFGVMRSQGSDLSAAERQAVADFLSPMVRSETARENACPGGGPRLSNVNGWNGWGIDLFNTRMQPAAAAGLRAADIPRLKVKWAFGFPNTVSVAAQVTAVGGRLFFGSSNGTVYSLDARSGCVHWTFKADGQVRAAITVAPAGSGQYAAYFGDATTTLYAVNAQTGQLLWRTKLDDHRMAGITGAPKLYGGRLYVGVRSGGEEVAAGDPKYPCCTFRGSLAAVDAANGKIVWKTFTVTDPPKQTRKSAAGTDLFGPSGAGIWSSPVIDVKRKAVYAGTGNNYSDPPTNTSDALIAFDMDSGSMRWVKQLTADAWNLSCAQPGKPSCPENPDRDVDIGSSPILRSLPGGKDILLVGQKSGIVFGMDPDQRGEILWHTEIGKGGAMGGIQWGMAADSEKVYAPLSDIIPGPGGGMFALKIASGEKVWSVAPAEPACKQTKGCSPAQSAAASLIPGVVFSGSFDGHLRAYSTTDGKVIWDLDTLRDFDTVNGVKAHGGSMNVAGPAIAAGMLFVNSGYNLLVGMPGNVLLALSVDGK
ncbi:MAG: cytochrome C oxidase Cbb3 [Terriglobia bacterium]|nr:MAG: cytochrome C oxidase Cbb3 [Terriglobia bacterium]